MPSENVSVTEGLDVVVVPTEPVAETPSVQETPVVADVPNGVYIPPLPPREPQPTAGSGGN